MSAPPPSRSPARLDPVEGAVLCLFFLSGAAALIYEVVWTRDLTNVFGGSAFAIATVLAAYMAGLALGSAVLGRVIDRRGHPLLVYGLLELGIGLWATLLPALLHGLNGFFVHFHRSIHPDPALLSLVRFLLSFLVLLVPTTLMGGTLPVLGKLLLRNWRGLGGRAGLLYGINTLGAVVGVAGGGFVLLPFLGLRNASHVAVGANVLVAALAMILASRIPFTREEAPREEGGADGEPPGLRPGLRRVVLIVYAASGFAALSYEVAWTKTLSLILGSTTYAFSAMLTTFLLGLSVGSLVAGWLADRTRRPEVYLALVQAAIPVGALLSIPLLQSLPQLYVNGFNARGGDGALLIGNSWAKVECFRVLLAALVMIVPTLLMGAMFPLVTRSYLARGRAAGSLGTLYASNTVGAILGSVVTGFLLLPWLGRQNAILAASLVNVAAALLLLFALGRRGLPRPARIAAAVLLLALVPAWVRGLERWDPYIMASGVFAYAMDMKNVRKDMEEHNLLYYVEDTEATVSVWNSSGGRTLRINGKVDASSHGDLLTQKLCGHLPGMYRAGNPGGDVLLVGLASGISAGAVLDHPFRSLETCELLRSVVPATRYFSAYNGRCLDDPRHDVVINDGRNHLLLTDRTFDVIVNEPTNPEIAGVGSLFTREFFELTRAHLRPGGMLCQWTQLYHLKKPDIQALLGTMREVYPYLHVWEGTTNDLLMVASLTPLSIDWTAIQGELQGKLGQDLDLLEIPELTQLLAYYVCDEKGVDAFVGGTTKRVTDANLLLEYSAPRNVVGGGWASALDLNAYHTPLTPYLRGAPPDLEARVERYRSAHLLAVRGQIEGPLTNWTGSPREMLEESLALVPSEIGARTMLSTLLVKEAAQAMEKGEKESAAVMLRRVSHMGDRLSRAIALNNLGSMAYQAGAVDSAEVLWERAYREGSYDVCYNMALVAARRGDYAEAVRLLEESVAWYPDNASALNNLAYYLTLSGGDPARALAAARHAVRLNHDPEHRDTLGLVLVNAGKYPEAEKILSRVVREKPEKMESLFTLGRARAGRGKREEARQAFTTVAASALDPDLVRRAQDELRKL